MDASKQTEYLRLRTAQRAAYLAWQAAPAGQGNDAIDEYERASKALFAFETVHIFARRS